MSNYHKIDTKILQFDLESIEFKFGMWITKKEFKQRLNDTNPLPKGQFYMSVRIVSKDIDVTEMVARRLIKQFTKLEIIRLVEVSKSPKKGSIFEYLVQVENNTVDNTVKTQLEHSKSEELSDFEEGKEHSKNTVDNTVNNTSKNKIKIKENIYINIYSDLEPKIKELYPGKKTKSVRDKKVPGLIKEYGGEQVIRCIERYAKQCKAENKEKQYILNEGTFWNGRYMDFLDSNYHQELTKPSSKTIKFTDFS